MFTAFLSAVGSDLVDWLHSNVEGFIDRRHARKYAALMLKHGFVRHTVNKITFSEQCYYIFGDFKKAAQSLPSGMLQIQCRWLSCTTIDCDENSYKLCVG